MRRVLFAGAFFATLLFAQACMAFQLGGNWIINANGWKFVMKISQHGQNFSGKMTPLNNSNSVTTIKGHIANSGEINFRRIEVNQEYHGFIFRGIEKGRHMAGTFGNSTQLDKHRHSWVAELQK